MLDNDYKLNYQFFLEQYRNYGKIIMPQTPAGVHVGTTCVLKENKITKTEKDITETKHIEFLLNFAAEIGRQFFTENYHKTYFSIKLINTRFWISVPLFDAFLEYKKTEYKIDTKLDTPSEEDIIHADY